MTSPGQLWDRVARLAAVGADFVRRARREPRPLDWAEVLRDSLDDAQRETLARGGYFEVPLRGHKVRVLANGSTPGFCIWPAEPPDFAQAAELAERGAGPNPWVAYQKKLWLEASPEVFVAVANRAFRSDTVPRGHVTRMASRSRLPRVDPVELPAEGGAIQVVLDDFGPP